MACLAVIAGPTLPLGAQFPVEACSAVACTGGCTVNLNPLYATGVNVPAPPAQSSGIGTTHYLALTAINNAACTPTGVMAVMTFPVALMEFAIEPPNPGS